MKIKIEIDESLQEDEVLIRCRGLTDEVTQIQKSVSDVVNAGQKYVFYKGTTEYYLQLDDVLFFRQKMMSYTYIQRMTCMKRNISCISWRRCCRDFL